jgi:methyltransferase (TIGR00027 family)
MFPERPIRRNEVGARVSRHMIIDKMLCDAVVGTGSSSNSHSVPHGPRQVVSLGAGFESRANRFHREIPITKWFEVDLPGPQKHKQDILREHGIQDPEHLIRIPFDVTSTSMSKSGDQEDWLSALKNEGWDPAAPTIYILEGLVYYLKVEEVYKLLHSIPSVPNSRIICSVVDYNLYKQIHQYMSWKSNFRSLERAGALTLANYKLVQNASVNTPHRYGLNVRFLSRVPGNASVGKRMKSWILKPCERILEFRAV